MKFMIFADLHHFNADDLQTINSDFNYIILLGDIKASSIMIILDFFPDKKVYGVLGNHDDIGLFDSVNKINGMKHKLMYGYNTDIINIHLRQERIDNILLFGIEGSVKYKENMIGFTQDEAMLLDIPYTDILFIHDSGYLYFPEKKDDPCHEGLKAISKYIKEKQPLYHIFGHQHETIEFYNERTKCICVYGCSLLDYDSGEIVKYF